MDPEDVNPIVPESPEQPIEPEAPVEPPVEAPQAPGSKTDSELLLASLQQERAKRRELEAALAAKEASENPEGIVSEEGKALESKIVRLEAAIASTAEQSALNALEVAHPALKDKAAEFDLYRNDLENKGMSLATAAKAFLVENGLLTPPRVRRGLEEARGGQRTPPKEGMSAEEVDELRNNNFREYMKRVKDGSLIIAQ
jgi:hypothetical protein